MEKGKFYHTTNIHGHSWVVLCTKSVDLGSITFQGYVVVTHNTLEVSNPAPCKVGDYSSNWAVKGFDPVDSASFKYTALVPTFIHLEIP